jgi:hypothetical protein
MPEAFHDDEHLYLYDMRAGCIRNGIQAAADGSDQCCRFD